MTIRSNNISNNSSVANNSNYSAYRWDKEMIERAEEVGRLIREQEKEQNDRRESSTD